MPDKQVRAARCAAIVAVLMALWLGGRAWASTTATVTLGGAEQSGDSGNITLSFNGFSETVEYGQYFDFGVDRFGLWRNVFPR